MYCVVRGEKHFTLLPPSDVLFLYEQEYAQGRYRRTSEGGGFEVEMEEGTVPWIPVGDNGRQHARAGNDSALGEDLIIFVFSVGDMRVAFDSMHCCCRSYHTH